ncbi:hypothetical protein [Paraglaciecola sp.]|uniref:hypothetical protein n=1 Tax=Paraglaciecola sp. TaxID=1920173 RepID=UPI00273EA9E2|nr:hypothetical protein [Paraglaciecola sp.]MDP5032703.1 hypothetical protein [Paraglaciecola sp.]
MNHDDEINKDSNCHFERRACPYCAEEISSFALICKHCKSSLSETAKNITIKKVPALKADKKVENLKSKAIWNDKVKVVKGKYLAANLGGGCLGLLLCFTGIGAIIGIPMLLASCFVPSGTKGAWCGTCPVCNSNIEWDHATKATKQGCFCCPSCNINIDFYNGNFHHTPPDL